MHHVVTLFPCSADINSAVHGLRYDILIYEYFKTSNGNRTELLASWMCMLVGNDIMTYVVCIRVQLY